MCFDPRTYRSLPHAFAPIELLGTRFHRLTVVELIALLVDASGDRERKTYVGHVNVHGMNLASSLPWYRDCLNSADLVFCDGWGVLLAAKLRRRPVGPEHRMTCADYLTDLAKACEASGTSMFLLAGRPGVNELALEKLRAVAPHLRIAGHHGHFPKHGPENDEVVRQINDFRPDILYVGFGMPLQEQWIGANAARIDASVFLPLGACLDWYTGVARRAPQWMRELRLEWLYRLVREPRRLWRRYLIGNPVFLGRVLLDAILPSGRAGG